MASSGSLSLTNRAVAALIAFSIILIACVSSLLYPQALSPLHTLSQNAYFWLWPNSTPQQQVYTVYLSETQELQTRQPIYQRLELAQTLEKLGQYAPSAIILDLDLRGEDQTSPSKHQEVYNSLSYATGQSYPDHDWLLQSAIARHPVYVNHPLSEQGTGKPFLSSALQVATGHTVQTDQQYEQGLHSNLYLNNFSQNNTWHTSPAQAGLEQVQSSETVRPDSNSLKEFMIYPEKGWQDSLVPAQDLLKNAVNVKSWPPEQRSVFFIGLESRNSYKQALALKTLQTGIFIAQPTWGLYAQLAVMLGFGAGLIFVATRRPMAYGILLCLAVLAVVFAASFYQFIKNAVFVDPLLPVLTLWLAFAVASSLTNLRFNRGQAGLKAQFQAILAPKQLREMMKSQKPPELAGHLKEITALSIRIGNFRRFYERLDPQDLAVLSNTAQTAWLDEVHVHGGTLNTMLSDGMTAYWNAPLPDPFHASHACKTAKELQKKAERYDQKDLFHLSKQTLRNKTAKVGIGIATGRVTLGDMGTRRHFRYAPLGPCVDLSETLSQHTAQAGHSILICQSTCAHVPELAVLETIPAFVSGYEERAFALVGDASLAFSEEFLQLKTRHCAMVQAFYQDHDLKAALTLLDDCRAMAGEAYAGIYEAFEKAMLKTEANQTPLKHAAQ